jgi:hypothetical protein
MPNETPEGGVGLFRYWLKAELITGGLRPSLNVRFGTEGDNAAVMQ